MIRKIFQPSVLKISLVLALFFMGLAIVLDQSPQSLPFLDAITRRVNVDAKFLLRGRRPVADDIVIIEVDDSSIEQLGRWPWDRGRFAKLIQNVAAGHPKVISLDMVFSELDAASKIEVFKQLQQQYQRKHGRDQFYKTLSREALKADTDRALAETIKKITPKIPIVLGYFFYFSEKDVEKLTTDWEAQFKHIFDSKITAKISTVRTPPEEIPTGIGARSSHKIYAEATHHHGFFDVSSDQDGMVRKIHLIGKYKETLFPSFALKTAALARQKRIVVQFGPLGIENIFLGEDALPINERGELWINYAGPARAFPSHSFADVYTGKIPASAFKDKIVLIGVTAKGIGDMLPSPVDPRHPGVEINATIIENIHHRNFLTRSQKAIVWEILFIVLAGVLLGFLFKRLRIRSSAMLTVVLLAITFYFDQKFFFEKGILTNAFVPTCQLFFTFIVTKAYTTFVEEKKSRQIKAAFEHYVSPSVVNEILKYPDQLKLGGEKRKLSVLFSDIRGFTTISEQLEPEKLTRLLNLYLTEMTNIVFDFRGMLDKYVGDELMAVYGAPLKTSTHALDACKSAIAMIQKLSTVSAQWAAAGVQRLNIGIGIHTGDMIVGNMGSSRIFDYTVIGDSVNLGSRLQGTNKAYGTHIIVSEEVHKQVSREIPCRELDYIRVRGKKEPVRIYEVLTTQIDEKLSDLFERYQKALTLYRNQKWQEASQRFQKLQALDPPSKTLFERCQLYQKTPPPAGWDGVFTMRTK